MGLGAGGVVGIVLAVLVVVAAAGFLLYRHLRARQAMDDGKRFETDYPASKPVELAATQASPTEYDFTSGAATPPTGGGDTGKSGASSIAMLNPQMASSPGSYFSAAAAPPSHNGGGVHLYSAPASSQPPRPQQQQQYEADTPSAFEMSQVKYSQMPSLDSSHASPPFHATDEVPLPSKRSPTHLEEASTEFHSNSLAESYAESYGAGSYRGTYGAQSLLGSFDQGQVDTRPFGESLTDNAPRGRESSADASDAGGPHGGADKSHWLAAMDDMRGTNDSYAMLESGSFDRTSALSRFSTDSDMHARDTNY